MLVFIHLMVQACLVLLDTADLQWIRSCIMTVAGHGILMCANSLMLNRRVFSMS